MNIKKRIIIITGQIGSGKTTYLRESIKNKSDIGGILQVSRGNRRFFSDIISNDEIELTSEIQNKESFILGKFIFKRSAFTWANKKLLIASRSTNIQTIILDEYGPLEFREEGFEPLFSKILENNKTEKKLNLIVVVRKSLLTKFAEKFNLSNKEINIIEVNKNLIDRF